VRLFARVAKVGSTFEGIRRGPLAAGIAAVLGAGAVVLSASPAAAAGCQNEAVRVQEEAQSLPECRAYEIVNPPALDYSEVNRVSAISDDGKHVAFLSVIPADDALGGAVTSTSVATRTPGGWTSLDANALSRGPVLNNTQGATPIAFSSDFSQELSFTNSPIDPADPGGLDGYRIKVGTGQAIRMTHTDVAPEQLFGGTSDLREIVYRLAPGAAQPGLYATDGTTTELLSLDEGEAPFGDSFPVGAAYQRGLGVGELRTQDPWVDHGGAHGVSDDLERIYFRDSAPGGGRLYVRDRLATPGPKTYMLTKSQRSGDLGTPYPGEFISATHDGSVAYFVSAAQLTDTSTPGGGIYRFTVAGQTLTQITPDAGNPAGLNLAGAIGSDDESHIYFTSTSALAGAAVAGEENAYVWTEADGVRFIAQVNPGDRFERVSRDGRYALMSSTASIEGAPNAGHTAIYEYDYATGKMTCVSCRADGSPSQGDATLEYQPFGFPVGGIAGGMTHPRNITDDGKVFFMTRDRLVAADQTSALDVYVYSNGVASLLTKGEGDSDSFLGDNSDSGEDAFVITRSALVGADRDAHEYDVYDVKVGGGFLEPEATLAACSGDGCQGAPNPAPQTNSPASASYVGPPNPKPKQTKPKPKGPKKHKKKNGSGHHKKGKKKAGAKRTAGSDGRSAK
jgi:hypothetical protein